MDLEPYNNTSNIKVLAGDVTSEGVITKSRVKKLLKPNVVDGVNIIDADMLSDEDTIYVVKYDFHLGGIEVKYANISSDNEINISGVTYYYTPITLAKNKKITLLDTTHCILLEELTSLYDGTTITTDAAITVYIASTTAATYSDCYKIENVVTVPNNCIIQFDGGTINDGVLNINNADILPRYNYLEEGEELTIEGYPAAGCLKWDNNSNKPLWSTGSNWVDSTGSTVE